MADNADPETTPGEQPPEKEETPTQVPVTEEPTVVEQSNEGDSPSSSNEGTEVKKEEEEASEGQQQTEEPPVEAPTVDGEESANNEQDKQTSDNEAVTSEDATADGVTGDGVTSEGATGEGVTGEGEAGEGEAGEGEAGEGEAGEGEQTGENKEEPQDNTASQEIEKESEEKEESTPLIDEDDQETTTSGVQSGDTVEEERELHRPTTLEGIMENEGDEEELSEEEALDREEAIEIYKSLLAEQEKLNAQNAQLQHKIAEYLARKKTDERTDPARNTTDQEQRYLKCLEALGQLQMEMTILQEDFINEEQQLKRLRQDKQERVEQARRAAVPNEFESYVREKAITAVHSRTGKKLPLQMVNDYLSQMERKDLEVRQVRLENIKLQNKIAQHEALIKKKEQLAEGLHMIDFEQLKINNVDLNEKIEERNEDILKLRKKVTSTVQVLAHLKEKLQFVQAESNDRETRLKELDEVVAQKRDQLTRLKHVRDAVRSETVKLKHKGGLIGHTALLRDMEDRQEQGVVMREQLHNLQQQYTELTLKCDGIKRKIDQTKSLHNRY